MFACRLLFLSSGLAAVAGGSDRVLLSGVKSLTFRKGKLTTGRRSSPVQQLQCVKGSGCGEEEQPEILQCTNQGEDDTGDIQWSCTGNIAGGLKLGETTVSCEGYSSSSDPYILAGSCAVEYELTSTRGSRGGGSSDYSYGSGYWDRRRSGEYSSASSTSGSVIGSVIVVAVLAGVAYFACFAAPTPGAAAAAAPAAPRGGGGWGGGGGGGWGGGGGGGGAPGAGGGWGSGSSSSYSTSGAPPAAAPPAAGLNNFLGGAALGGLAGYMLGGRQRYGGGFGNGGYMGGGGLFGGGAPVPRGFGGGFGGGGGGGFGGGGAQTGFGGTRRR